MEHDVSWPTAVPEPRRRRRKTIVVYQRSNTAPDLLVATPRPPRPRPTVEVKK